MIQLSCLLFNLLPALYRPDNTENNVYEIWVHATRLRDPARVKPLVKSQDPPLSKVTLRTRKRLCRGKSHLILFINISFFSLSLSRSVCLLGGKGSSFCFADSGRTRSVRIICFDWLGKGENNAGHPPSSLA